MNATDWNLSADSASIRLEGVQTPIGLRVSEVTIEGKGLAFEGEARRFSIEEPAQVTATVVEADLEAFLTSRTPEGVQITSVRLEPGSIRVEAKVTMIVQLSGTAYCTLAIEEGERLLVRAESVDMLGGSLKGMVQKQLDALNPVLDASTFPFDAHFDSVAIEPGRIVLQGHAAPPAPGD